MRARRFFVWPAICAAAGAVLVVPVAGFCLSGVAGLKPVLEAIEDDYYLDTEHPAVDVREQFIVYAKDGTRAQEVLAVALKYRTKAQRFFGTSTIWELPALILVYPDKAAYDRSTGLVGTGGMHIQTRYKGKRVKLVLTHEGEGVLDHTLPHELMHLLITDMSNRDYFAGAQDNIVGTTVWIQEGLAESLTADADRRADFERLVRWKLHTGELIPLRRLLARMNYEREMMLHYAQSYSFVAFIAATMQERGRQRLRNYITSYNDSRLAGDPIKNFTLAFQGVAPSIEVLEQRWHAWVARSYRRHFSPVVLQTKPAAKATGVQLDGRIWVKFDKPVDPDTLGAETMALRRGDSTKLGDDKDNLLHGGAFRYDAGTSVLLIEVPGGLEPGRKYTLAFSDGVKDGGEHGLVAEKFDEMKSDGWWKSGKAEPRPDEDEGEGEGEEEKEKKKTPPKLVTSIWFKTKAEELDNGGAPR